MPWTGPGSRQFLLSKTVLNPDCITLADINLYRDTVLLVDSIMKLGDDAAWLLMLGLAALVQKLPG